MSSASIMSWRDIRVFSSTMVFAQAIKFHCIHSCKSEYILKLRYKWWPIEKHDWGRQFRRHFYWHKLIKCHFSNDVIFVNLCQLWYASRGHCHMKMKYPCTMYIVFCLGVCSEIVYIVFGLNVLPCLRYNFDFSAWKCSQFPLSGGKLATTESRYQARCYFTFPAFFGCHLHESYEVYKLLAFTSLIRSVIISPFFHHIIFSLARSYLGAIVTSKIEVSASFILRTNTVQYACVLDYAWRTNLQFETGLKKAEEKTEVQCTEKQNLKIKKQNSRQQA